MLIEELLNLAGWLGQQTMERLKQKAGEYSDGFDCLGHLKRSGRGVKLHPLTAGSVLLDKHILAIYNRFCPMPKEFDYEFLRERIIDAMCFLCLLYALGLEELEQRKEAEDGERDTSDRNG